MNKSIDSHNQFGFYSLLLLITIFLSCCPLLSTQATTSGLFSSTTTMTDPATNTLDAFGYSIAVSADGNTALIGAYGTVNSGNANSGAVYLYTRTNGVWSLTPTHVFSDPLSSHADFFGAGVALSADGSVVLIGASGTTVSGNAAVGVVYLYNQTNGTWPSTPTVTFSDPNNTANDTYGNSVSLSGDGKTALIGSPGATLNGNTYAGMAYVYAETNGVWASTPTASFNDPPASADDSFGVRVTLSSDGSTALIGANGTIVNGNGYAGAAYLYNQSNGVWSTTPTTFSDPDGLMTDLFGGSVSLSSNGSMALVGAAGVKVSGNSSVGSAYLYVETNGTWTNTPSHAFSDPPGLANDQFGAGVALSANGGIAVIGAPGTTVSGNSVAGVAYIYFQTSGAWPNIPTMTFNDPLALHDDLYGSSTALSADETEALIGAPGQPVYGGTPQVGNVYAISDSADLSLALSAMPASVTAGQSVALDATVTNNDPAVTAYNVTLKDTLPMGLGYASSNGAGGSCSANGLTVTCTLASLAPGVTWQPTITVATSSNGSISDSMSVSSNEPDPVISNNSASANITVTSSMGSGGGGGYGGGGGVLGILSLLLLGLSLLGRRRISLIGWR